MDTNSKTKIGLMLYSSMTRKKETFQSVLPNFVSIYFCGPTVYGPVHLGHARTFLAYDLIRRYLQSFYGWKVVMIQNITDVGHIVGDAEEGEDKIQRQAKLEQVHPMEIVDRYTEDMWRNFDLLHYQRPNIAPRATGHIIEIIDMVNELIRNGFAYEVDGDVYFEVAKFSGYGKLSGNSAEKLLAGARIEVNSKKRNPLDFALWKKADPNHIMQWTSPWGKGYPGWHIECSVMSEKYLGTPFDIHGGAVELKFPHHENEIAQSEALGGGFANYWVHTGMLMIDGRKMGKSLGNFLTISDALKKYSPRTLRYFILSSHYRSNVDLSDQAVQGAEKALSRIDNFFFQIKSKAGSSYSSKFEGLLESFSVKFESAMADDFNTPVAVSHIFDLMSELNKLAEMETYDQENVATLLSYFRKIDSVFDCFGLHSTEEVKTDGMTEAEVKKMIEERARAKQEKDWALADQIRKTLEVNGIKLFDGKDGVTTYTKT